MNILRITNKTITALLLFLIIVVGGVVIPVDTQTALAEEETSTSVSDLVIRGFGTVLGGVGDAAAWISGNLFNVLANVFEELANFFMTLSATLFDSSIEYSLKTNNLRLDAIKTTWEIIRDVANIVFIFVLLYIAITTILRLNTANTKRMLAMLIVMALLVNFSFFLTGVVIDASNILAITIYDGLTACPPEGAIDCSEEKGEIRPISHNFAVGLKITKIFDSATIEDISAFQEGMVHLFIGIVFFMIGFVFFSGALLFLLRTVYLMFILILSPLAFVAAAFPGTKQYFDQWLDKLIRHSFIAPIYLLAISIVVAIINGGEIFTTSGTEEKLLATAVTEKTPEALEIFLPFFIIMGLIYGALMIARKVAGDIAGMSIGATKKILSAAPRYLKKAARFTPVGRIGGAVLGRAGRAAEGLQKSTGRVAGTLRKIPGVVRGAGVLGAKAQVDIENYKKQNTSLSSAALKNRAALRMTSVAERGAITEVLAARKDLKPEREFSTELIEGTTLAMGNRGRSTREVEALQWQYVDIQKLSDDYNKAKALGNTSEADALDEKIKKATATIKPESIADVDEAYFKDPSVRSQFYKQAHGGHIQSLLQRPKNPKTDFDAAHEFFEGLKESTDKGGAGTTEIPALITWLEQNENRSLAAWARSPGGEQTLKSYGFTKPKETEGGGGEARRKAEEEWKKPQKKT